jgi:hypothetical protein
MDQVNMRLVLTLVFVGWPGFSILSSLAKSRYDGLSEGARLTFWGGLWYRTRQVCSLLSWGCFAALVLRVVWLVARWFA